MSSRIKLRLTDATESYRMRLGALQKAGHCTLIEGVPVLPKLAGGE